MPTAAALSGVLITDFDGTLTEQDFFWVALERLAPPEARRHWTEFEARRITHFEALRRIFADIRRPEADVRRALDAMKFDPDNAAAIRRLTGAGWGVYITSAGCGWYIEQLLEGAGVAIAAEDPWDRPRGDPRVSVLANPGRFQPERGFVMEPPRDSPYVHPTIGTDKAAVVKAARRRVADVAYAGDSPTDVDAALGVSSDRRFARRWLPDELAQRGETFQTFARWPEIADRLLR